MTIMISRLGDRPQSIPKAYLDEVDLKDYIVRVPESIIHEIKEGVKLVIAAREFQTYSGPIDLIGFDNKGNIYLIETKLYKNSDKRRVLAQVLDYASAIKIDYQNFDKFQDELEKKLGKSLEEFLKKSFDLDETELKKTIGKIKMNLSSGEFVIVIVMDELDNRLKEQVSALNEKAKSDICLLELPYYKFNDYEITIPRIFNPNRSNDEEYDWNYYSKNLNCPEDKINLLKRFVKMLDELFEQKSLNVITRFQKSEITYRYKTRTVCNLGYDKWDEYGVYLSIKIPKKENDLSNWEWDSVNEVYYQYFGALPSLAEIEPIIMEAYNSKT